MERYHMALAKRWLRVAKWLLALTAEDRCVSYITGDFDKGLLWHMANLFGSGGKKPHWWSAVGGGVRSRRNA